MVNEERGKCGERDGRGSGRDMSRSELAQQLATRGGVSLATARRFLDLLFGAASESGLITAALERRERVGISGFGTLEVRERGARRLRNPRTGELHNVPARSTVVFRPGAALKDRLR